MTGGLFIAIGGVWLLCQVFGGNALERIGLVKAAGPVTDSTAAINRLADQGKTTAPDATAAPGGLADALGGNVAGMGTLATRPGGVS